MTTYKLSMKVPGTDNEYLVLPPVENIREVFFAFGAACGLIIANDPAAAEAAPEWNVVAVDEDGSERALTATERAALTALFEQAAGGIRARLRPVNES